MPRHFLIPENGQPPDQWILEWNEVALTLSAPDGVCVIESSIDCAHQLFDQRMLYEEEQVSVKLPAGRISFPGKLDVLYDVKKLIENGLKRDPEFRANSARKAYWMIAAGIVVSLLGASLFGHYCWWASSAPDPEAGHWVRSLGPLIRYALFGLLGMAIGGPLLSLAGFSQLRRIQKIENEMFDDGPFD